MSRPGPAASTGTSRVAPTDSTTLHGIVALIVEDDFLSADAMRCAVEHHGGVVLGPAPDAASARALLRARRPDLALLDVHLRGGTTAALARELWVMNVPVLVVTGYSAADLLPTELRGLPRVIKPFTGATLLRAIERALAARDRQGAAGARAAAL